jgi:integrase
VELFKKRKSKFYWYDFTVGGRRYRGSTKESNKARAGAIAALKLANAIEGRDPLPRKAPGLLEFSGRFLEWVKNVKLEHKTKLYYRDGWRLLADSPITRVRLDKIMADDIEALGFAGSPSNANCALRTLRRILHKAEEWGVIRSVPKFKLLKEYGRSLRLDENAERKLLAVAEQPLRDAIILMRDTGMRNERELYRTRIENIDWNGRVIFVPDSKTPNGRRLVPMTDRVLALLLVRCGDKREGWLFLSKRSKSGHLTTLAKRFREARKKAGLSESLVLYCGRHDYGTRVLKATGNLAAVMKTMGHKDVKTAMQYQHPEVDLVRQALNHNNTRAEKDATVQ